MKNMNAQRSELLACHHSDINSKIGFKNNHSAVINWTLMYCKKNIISLPPPILEYEGNIRQIGA